MEASLEHVEHAPATHRGMLGVSTFIAIQASPGAPCVLLLTSTDILASPLEAQYVLSVMGKVGANTPVQPAYPTLLRRPSRQRNR